MSQTLDSERAAGSAPARPSAATPARTHAARLAALGTQVAVATGALAFPVYAGRGRTFFFDEWDWVQHRAEGGMSTLFRPHNGHLMPLPVAWYRLQFELVGFTYAWPVRLVTAAAHVAAAWVLFRPARARVGDTAAACVAAVFLGLGAAWQTLLWGIQLSVTVAVLGGLVAWLALDQESRSAGIQADVPSASRYIEIGAPILLLLGVELCRGRRLSGWWRVPAVAVVALCLWRGGAELLTQGDELHSNSQHVLASLAAVELGRGYADTDFGPFALERGDRLS
jgi:hypothetical protein